MLSCLSVHRAKQIPSSPVMVIRVNEVNTRFNSDQFFFYYFVYFMLCVCTFWSNHTQQLCWAEPRAMMEGNYKWGALNLTDWLLLLLLLLMMKMSFDGGVRVGISHVRVRSGPGWLAGAVSKCDLMYGFCPTRSSNSLAWGAPFPGSNAGYANHATHVSVTVQDWEMCFALFTGKYHCLEDKRRFTVDSKSFLRW